MWFVYMLGVGLSVVRGTVIVSRKSDCGGSDWWLPHRKEGGPGRLVSYFAPFSANV